MGGAAVLLVGGRSTRMGRSKAELSWHGQPFADRIARLLLRATRGTLVVVAAPDQNPPPLPPEAIVVRDAHDGQGPLEAIAAGLRALPPDAVAYVSSTDVPLLHPAFVEHVVAAVDEHTDIAVCQTEGRLHPLAAAYRAGALPAIEELLAGGQRRPIALFDRVRTRVLDRGALLANEAIARLDGTLQSLLNVNRPDDYERAHELDLPAIAVERFGLLRSSEPRANGMAAEDDESARAATLGALADAVGVELAEHVVAALNGEQVTTEAALPLVAGDRVAFLSADGGG